jgi:hypothetical protein
MYRGFSSIHRLTTAVQQQQQQQQQESWTFENSICASLYTHHAEGLVIPKVRRLKNRN